MQVSYTLTRGQPAGWTGHTGRIDSALLAEVAWPVEANPLAYICGPTSFVETAAAGLVGLGYPPERVKTERFGGLDLVSVERNWRASEPGDEEGAR